MNRKLVRFKFALNYPFKPKSGLKASLPRETEREKLKPGSRYHCKTEKSCVDRTNATEQEPDCEVTCLSKVCVCITCEYCTYLCLTPCVDT